jgi:hypothetical protein
MLIFIEILLLCLVSSFCYGIDFKKIFLLLHILYQQLRILTIL